MKHQKPLVLALLCLSLAVLAFLPQPAQAARPPAFQADLTGPDISVERTPGHYIVILRSTGHYLDPGAITDATGSTSLTFLEPGLHYRLMVNDLEEATEVNLHLLTDRDGQVFNDVVATLWSGKMEPGPFSGRLGGGWLMSRDIGGPLTGQGLSGLLREMTAGNIYVVVHTVSWPKGEIGGPAFPLVAP